MYPVINSMPDIPAAPTTRRARRAGWGRRRRIIVVVVAAVVVAAVVVAAARPPPIAWLFVAWPLISFIAFTFSPNSHWCMT